MKKKQVLNTAFSDIIINAIQDKTKILYDIKDFTDIRLTKNRIEIKHKRDIRYWVGDFNFEFDNIIGLAVRLNWLHKHYIQQYHPSIPQSKDIDYINKTVKSINNKFLTNKIWFVINDLINKSLKKYKNLPKPKFNTKFTQVHFKCNPILHLDENILNETPNSIAKKINNWYQYRQNVIVSNRLDDIEDN